MVRVGLGERVVVGAGELDDDDSESHSFGRPLPGIRRTGMGLVTDGLL